MAFVWNVRPQERRDATLAFAVLFGITAAHTLLETSRDALFLANAAVAHLPILYVVIAALGFASARIAATLAARRQSATRDPATRRVDPLSISLAVVGAATLVLWALLALHAKVVVYAVYLYVSLAGAWVAAALWDRLGAVFDVGQAKRLFGPIGTGGVLGAVAGAALARVSLAVIDVRHLLALGAAVMLATAVPAALLPRATSETRPRRAREAPGDRKGVVADVRATVRDPYVGRVLAIVLLTAAAATAIDYLFKSEVVARVETRKLGTFLATVSLATNAASLLAQALGVGLVLRVLGLHRALLVLPLLVAAGAGAGIVAASLGAAAAIGLRGVDGSLRYSLQKTSVELLYLPLADTVRARAKPIIDLLGQRGGQALASLVIVVVAARGGTRAVAAAIFVFAVLWVLVARGVLPRYLDVFRNNLALGRVAIDAGMPDLDVRALEELVASLSSTSDARVLGALELLAAQARGRVIPTLVLFHPSKLVVLRALELLVREGRKDLAPVAERLLGHADPEVRAAALRARAAVDPDGAFVRARVADPAPELRATAIALLAAKGEAEQAALAEVTSGGVGARRALARALAEVEPRHPEAVTRALLALAEDEDVEARALAAAAMGRIGSRAFLEPLSAMLSQRFVRSAATHALAAMGDTSADFLDALLDARGPSEDDKARAASALVGNASSRARELVVARLLAPGDSPHQGRFLRALCTARVPLDARALGCLAEAAVARHASARALRLAYVRLSSSRPAPITAAAELLGQLLRDDEKEARDRLLCIVALTHPEENVARIRRGLSSGNAKLRAASRELLEGVLKAPLRERVLRVMDADAAAAREGDTRAETSYTALLDIMVASGGALGALAAYHAREIGHTSGSGSAPPGPFGEEARP